MFETPLLTDPPFEFIHMKKMMDTALALNRIRGYSEEKPFFKIIKQIDPNWGIPLEFIDEIYDMKSIHAERIDFYDYKASLIRNTKNYNYPLFTAFASSLYDLNPPCFLVEAREYDDLFILLSCKDGKLYKNVVSSFYFRKSDAVKPLKPVVQTKTEHNREFASGLAQYLLLRTVMKTKFETIDGNKYMLFDCLNSLFPSLNKINVDGSIESIDACLFFNQLKDDFPFIKPFEAIKDAL